MPTPTREEILAAVLALWRRAESAGKSVDVINNRCVLAEGGYLFVEGSGNRKFGLGTDVIDAIAKPLRRRAS